MKQTTLAKLPDQSKFILSKRSKVIYTKQTKWRRSGGLMAYVFTSNSSGLTFKRVGSVKVWVDEFIVNKSTGSTVARTKKRKK